MIANLQGVKETVDYEDKALVRLYHNVEKEGYPLHWHPAIEIIAPLAGDYELNIQNHLIHLSPGEILWIAPGVLHIINEPKTEGRRLIILMNPTIIQQFEDLATIQPFLTPFKKITAEEFPSTHMDLLDILRNTLSIELTNNPLKNVEIYAELIRFMTVLGNKELERFASDLSAQMTVEESSASQVNYTLIYEACQYIRANSRKNLTLDHLSEKSGFSKFYFSRLFKEITGMSFIDYLKTCRINDVEQLLSDHDISITDVAITAGFNSLATFNRVFKSMKNITPQEFRKLHTISYSGEIG